MRSIEYTRCLIKRGALVYPIVSSMHNNDGKRRILNYSGSPRPGGLYTREGARDDIFARRRSRLGNPAKCQVHSFRINNHPNTISEVAMNRSAVLQLLAQHKDELARRFGVADLALFGSTVRDTARPDSDVDILVTFEGPATSARYFGTQFYLEDLLGYPVDLVTDKALRPELRPFITQEAVHV
jgi:hypothetical protein